MDQQPSRSRLADVLKAFPPVQYAFAYGSGVFRQANLYTSSTAAPLLDFIFAVEKPLEWHEQNIELNRRHYSCMANLGAAAVVSTAEHIGAGVYFNTLVPWKQRFIKYGVICTSSLCNDLLHWDTLYVSGRLQKPVTCLRDHPAVSSCVASNTNSALALSLLLLPPKFTTRDLNRSICGVSYMGDIRMGFAEDHRKVDKIVEGSEQGLAALYSGPIQGPTGATAVLQQSALDSWVQDDSAKSREALLAQMPMGVLERLARYVGMASPTSADDVPAKAAIAAAALSQGDYRKLLRRSVGSIVRSSSRRQAVAGLLSAGGMRSMAYLWQKMLKAWHSR